MVVKLLSLKALCGLVSILSNKCLMRDARQREMKIIRTKAGLENLQIQCTEKKLQNACFDWAFYSQDLYSNSPNCLLYNSCDIGWENLVLDQLIIPRLIFVFMLILFCMILYLYCKEKFCLGHSWELKV